MHSHTQLPTSHLCCRNGCLARVQETPELMEQLQQASKANDELAVVLAIEGDGKVGGLVGCRG